MTGGGRPQPAAHPVMEGVVAAALAALLLTLFLGAGYLPFDNDPAYADVIRTMLRTGNWLDPQIHGVPFLDKPPLFFWLAAAPGSLLGDGVGVLRLPAALLGAATAGVVFGAARRTGLARGWAAAGAVALLATPLWVEYSRRCYMEVPVAACVLGAILAFQHALDGLDDSGPRPRWYLAAGALVGLGFMLKSLVGLFGVIPFGLVVLARRRWATLGRAPLWGGVALAAAIVVPWHAYELVTNQDVFLQFTWKLHVQDQVFGAQPWSTGPPWFYLRALAEDAPLLGALIAVGGGLLAVRLVRREATSGLDRHLGLALLVMLAVFSASETKKVLYLVVAVPPAAMLSARMLSATLRAPRAAPLVLVLLGALAARTLPYYPPDGAFLRGSEPYAVAAPPAAAAAGPDEPVHLLDQYFSAAQYYTGRRAISWWTEPGIVRDTQRIPYIRLGENMRHVPPGQVAARVAERTPGLWYLRAEDADAWGLRSRGAVLYDHGGLLLLDTRPGRPPGGPTPAR